MVGIAELAILEVFAFGTLNCSMCLRFMGFLFHSNISAVFTFDAHLTANFINRFSLRTASVGSFVTFKAFV